MQSRAAGEAKPLGQGRASEVALEQRDPAAFRRRGGGQAQRHLPLRRSGEKYRTGLANFVANSA